MRVPPPSTVSCRSAAKKAKANSSAWAVVPVVPVLWDVTTDARLAASSALTSSGLAENGPSNSAQEACHPPCSLVSVVRKAVSVPSEILYQQAAPILPTLMPLSWIRFQPDGSLQAPPAECVAERPATTTIRLPVVGAVKVSDTSPEAPVASSARIVSPKATGYLILMAKTIRQAGQPSASSARANR